MFKSKLIITIIPIVATNTNKIAETRSTFKSQLKYITANNANANPITTPRFRSLLKRHARKNANEKKPHTNKAFNSLC